MRISANIKQCTFCFISDMINDILKKRKYKDNKERKPTILLLQNSINVYHHNDMCIYLKQHEH
jgi:hypothetical protein